VETDRIVQVVSIAITPRVVGDQALSRALALLATEDPAIRFRSDSATGRCTVAGVSDRHLEIIIDRLRLEFSIEAAVGPPSFLKAALSAEAIGEYKLHELGHGRQQYAHVKLRLTPQPDGVGYSFDDQTLGGSIPPRFVPEIEQGIDDARTAGICGGYPVDDVKVELVDGSYHEVDSTESAFIIAARQAFFEAATRAKPKVVEPVMRVVIAVPEEFLPDVMTDLERRRAETQMSDRQGDWCSLVALVPFARLIGYAHDLNQLSRGRATYSLHFACYQERDSFSDEGDGDSMVGAPRKPLLPLRHSAIALPEPDSTIHGLKD